MSTATEKVAPELQWRYFIKADGSTPYPPEANRYHIYGAMVCPFAQRALIMMNLKGLQEVVSETRMWKIDDKGWAFTDKVKGCSLDPYHKDFTYLRQIYRLTDANYEGVVSVPSLYDKKTDRIINNESAEIMTMFNEEMNSVAKFPERNFYPAHLKDKVDEMNQLLQKTIIFGMYKCGYAKTQEAYDKEQADFFNGLDKLEAILSTQRYLCGEQLTESDAKAFPVLLRLDPVAYLLLRCNAKRISDYPNLFGYLRELSQLPEFKDTVDIQQIKEGYYKGYKELNPLGIIPAGPTLDLTSPHGRDKLPGKPY